MKRTFALLGLFMIGVMLLFNPLTGIPATFDGGSPTSVDAAAIQQTTGAPPLDPNRSASAVQALQPDPTTSTGSTSTTTAPTTTTTTQPAAAVTVLGSSVSTRFGYFQVQVTLQDGSIVDITTVRQPTHAESRMINRIALPYYQQWAIDAQSARIDGISGATITWRAFTLSLQSALDQASTT